MTEFEKWFHKEYEPADLQIKQCAERNEVLHIPATVYLEDLKKAYEAGQKDREAQIEKMKCCFNCRHSRTECEHCRTDKHEKWEIKEND